MKIRDLMKYMKNAEELRRDLLNIKNTENFKFNKMYPIEGMNIKMLIEYLDFSLDFITQCDISIEE